MWNWAISPVGLTRPRRFCPASTYHTFPSGPSATVWTSGGQTVQSGRGTATGASYSTIPPVESATDGRDETCADPGLADAGDAVPGPEQAATSITARSTT